VLRGVGAASRFAKPQGGALSRGPAEAAGLPPLFAEMPLVSLRITEIPTGAFANRTATPAPRLSFLIQEKKPKWRQALFSNLLLDNGISLPACFRFRLENRFPKADLEG